MWKETVNAIGVWGRAYTLGVTGSGIEEWGTMGLGIASESLDIARVWQKLVSFLCTRIDVKQTPARQLSKSVVGNRKWADWKRSVVGKHWPLTPATFPRSRPGVGAWLGQKQGQTEDCGHVRGPGYWQKYLGYTCVFDEAQSFFLCEAN